MRTERCNRRTRKAKIINKKLMVEVAMTEVEAEGEEKTAREEGGGAGVGEERGKKAKDNDERRERNEKKLIDENVEQKDKDREGRKDE